MSTNKSISAIFILCLCLCSFSLDAQYGNKKKKSRDTKTEDTSTKSNTTKDRSTRENTEVYDPSTYTTESSASNRGGFASNLYFGANLGQIGLANNQLTIGLSPFIGYKIIPSVSVGILSKGSYNYVGTGSGTSGISWFNVGVGPFARVKILNQFFGQVEYEVSRSAIALNSNNEPVYQRRNFAYAGLGYLQGFDDLKYEFSINYNFSLPNVNILQRIDPRIGLSYRF